MKKTILAWLLLILLLAAPAKRVGAATADRYGNVPIYAFGLSRGSTTTYYYTLNPKEGDQLTGWSEVKPIGIVGYNGAGKENPIHRLVYRGSRSGLSGLYAYARDKELSSLTELGYVDEGVAFYMGDESQSTRAKIYCMKSKSVDGLYCFTPLEEERDELLNRGWTEAMSLLLDEMDYPSVPSCAIEPTVIGNEFLDQRLMLNGKNYKFNRIEVQNLSKEEYEIQPGKTEGGTIEFKSAGAAERAEVMAYFSNAGTYLQDGKKIPVDYSLKMNHLITCAGGARNEMNGSYRPPRYNKDFGRYYLWFADNPSTSSVEMMGIVSMDCEMKLYRAGTKEEIPTQDTYLSFGSLNGYDESVFGIKGIFDIEGVCPLSTVKKAYIVKNTILRYGVNEYFDLYMDPNNKGRVGYYGKQTAINDFIDGSGTLARDYNRSCVTLVFQDAMRFAVQAFNTSNGQYNWSLTAMPITATKPDPPVKSVQNAKGEAISRADYGEEVTFCVDQKVNTWAVDSIMQYSSFEFRDELPEKLTLLETKLLKDGQEMKQSDYKVTQEDRRVVCALKSSYLSGWKPEGETLRLVLRCRVEEGAKETVTNVAQTWINNTELVSNEVELKTGPEEFEIETGILNGEITPKVTKIPKGENRTISYQPHDGYVLKQIRVDQTTLTAEEMRKHPRQYEFTNVRKNHSIYVEYAKAEELFSIKKQVKTADGADANEKIVPVGKPLTYQIAVTNQSMESAKVTITDKLPEKMNAGAIQGGGNNENGTLIWKELTLGSGETKEVTFEATPQEANFLYENMARLQVVGVEIPSNTVRSWTIEPAKSVLDRSGKETAERTAALGETVTYRVRVENVGDQKKTFRITDQLPKEVEFLSATEGGTHKDGVVTFQSEIVPKGTFLADIKVRVREGGIFENTVQAASDSVTATSRPVKLTVCTLIVKKTDESGNALDGAGFLLQNSTGAYYLIKDGAVGWGTKEEASLLTTKDGQVSFTGLAPGEYTILEEVVPKGCRRAENRKVSVREEAETGVTIENERLEKLPAAGRGGSMWLLIGAASALAAGLLRRRLR
jgi:fimbrial isopeptide formation D2 family protein/uncharacterized repeat protein (TIGR01451 family)